MLPVESLAKDHPWWSPSASLGDEKPAGRNKETAYSTGSKATSRTLIFLTRIYI